MRRDKANSISFRFCLISDFLLLFSVFCFQYFVFRFVFTFAALSLSVSLSRFLCLTWGRVAGCGREGGVGVNVRHRVIGTFRGEYIFFLLSTATENSKWHVCECLAMAAVPLCPLTAPLCPLTPLCRGVFNYPVWLLICGFNAQVAQIGERVWITRGTEHSLMGSKWQPDRQGEKEGEGASGREREADWLWRLMRRLHLRHWEQTCKFADEIKLKAHTFHADNRRVVAGLPHSLLLTHSTVLPPAPPFPPLCVHIWSLFILIAHVSQILNANLCAFSLILILIYVKSAFKFYF